MKSLHNDQIGGTLSKAMLVIETGFESGFSNDMLSTVLELVQIARDNYIGYESCDLSEKAKSVLLLVGAYSDDEDGHNIH